jgi:N6-adenosine-specific RNA methylase IME4
MTKFSCIVADPAWEFSDRLNNPKGIKRGAGANYQTMTNEDIIALPVKSLADPDGCLLALWVPSSLLQTGLDVMKAWGFEMKTTFVWVKIKKDPFEGLRKALSIDDPRSLKERMTEVFNAFSWQNTLAFGMGRTFRASHEICLIGINNTGIYKKLDNRSQRTISLEEEPATLFAPNLGHSTKPDGLQNSLDLMFPNVAKIELYARRERMGWACLGNEIGMKEDLRVSIPKLLE